MVPGRPFFSRFGEEGELDSSGVTNSIFNVRLDGLNRIDRLNENGWTWDVEEKEEKEVKKKRYVQQLECRKEREFVMNKHFCLLCKSTATSENFSRNYFPEAG